MVCHECVRKIRHGLFSALSKHMLGTLRKIMKYII